MNELIPRTNNVAQSGCETAILLSVGRALKTSRQSSYSLGATLLSRKRITSDDEPNTPRLNRGRTSRAKLGRFRNLRHKLWKSKRVSSVK